MKKCQADAWYRRKMRNVPPGKGQEAGGAAKNSFMKKCTADAAACRKTV